MRYSPLVDSPKFVQPNLTLPNDRDGKMSDGALVLRSSSSKLRGTHTTCEHRVDPSRVADLNNQHYHKREPIYLKWRSLVYIC